MPTNPPITTALSLDTWRRTFGFHPWHFFGMADDTVIPVTPQCPTVVKQYAWQNTDAAGREDILNAIASAEQKLLDYLAEAGRPPPCALGLFRPTGPMDECALA
jgi:hypothetical protein